MADTPHERPVVRRRGFTDSEWAGSGATDAMHATLQEFSREAARQNATLVRLTCALVSLTAVLVVGLVVQIAVAIWG